MGVKGLWGEIDMYTFKVCIVNTHCDSGGVTELLSVVGRRVNINTLESKVVAVGNACSVVSWAVVPLFSLDPRPRGRRCIDMDDPVHQSHARPAGRAH